MKYFMQHRNEVAGPLELGQVGRMALLRTNTNVKELRYMLAMVDLLSTCAEVGLFCLFHMQPLIDGARSLDHMAQMLALGFDC